MDSTLDMDTSPAREAAIQFTAPLLPTTVTSQAAMSVSP
jgi:hypothetical protein